MTLNETREALRFYIKDHDHLNRLLKFEEENDSSHMDLYIHMAMSFLNSIPPIIQFYQIASFPFPALLIHQATIESLISNGIVQARNDLQYNNGGVTIKIADRDRYLGSLQGLFRLADSEISMYRQYKVAVNIEGGYGGVPSPYAYLSELHPSEL